jgi:hypothetical protein
MFMMVLTYFSVHNSIQVIQTRLAVYNTRLLQPLSYRAVTTTGLDSGTRKEYNVTMGI